MFHKKKWSLLRMEEIAAECPEFIDHPAEYPWAQKELLQTIEKLRAAVRGDSESFPLAYLLGFYCVEAGIAEEALSAFDGAASLRPADPDPLFQQADIYYRAAIAGDDEPTELERTRALSRVLVDLVAGSASASDIETARVDEQHWLGSLMLEAAKRQRVVIKMRKPECARTAIELFEKTLSLGLCKEDEEGVRQQMENLLSYARDNGWEVVPEPVASSWSEAPR